MPLLECGEGNWKYSGDGVWIGYRGIGSAGRAVGVAVLGLAP